MKTCTKCGESKPLIEFPRDKQKCDGLYSSCKLCHSIKSQIYGKQNKRKIQNNNLRVHHGITVERYEELLQQQDGACAICKGTTGKNLAVDHCHTTGRIRGLLCTRCNPGLGYFCDDISLLSAAIEYLEVNHGS